MSTIIIATGGTGGHIFPARVIAQALSQKKYKVVIFADKNYIKYHQEKDPYTFKVINSSQIKKNTLFLLKAGVKIILGVIKSFLLLLSCKTKVVIAFGGYPTFPTLISAVLLRKKIIIHEQNAHLGKINRIFAKYAELILLTYKDTYALKDIFLDKSIHIGNPIRDEILSLNDKEYILPKSKKEKLNNMGYNLILKSQFTNKKNKDLFNILVIGGSGGAKIFSDILPKALLNLREDIQSKISITQQCRKEYLDYTFKQYSAFNLNITLSSFFIDIDKKIEKAHLIIARAGSSSIAEFTAAKKPQILIPFIYCFR